MNATARPRLAPRKMRFQFRTVPTHWIPGRPFLTQFFNALHFLFEYGERWFCNVFRTALPYIEDDALRADVRGFIGQEATHFHHHNRFIEHLDEQQIRLPRVNKGIRLLLECVQEHAPLEAQVALIAGIEQYTAVLGAWVFQRGTLRRADPNMRELFHWHAAEELEHKHVAFDLLHTLRPGYAYRIFHFLLASFGLFAVWGIALAALLYRDRSATGRAVAVDFIRCVCDGSLPLGVVLRGSFSYFRPSFHPSQDDTLYLAARYFGERAG